MCVCVLRMYIRVCVLRMYIRVCVCVLRMYIGVCVCVLRMYIRVCLEDVYTRVCVCLENVYTLCVLRMYILAVFCSLCPRALQSRPYQALDRSGLEPTSWYVTSSPLKSHYEILCRLNQSTPPDCVSGAPPSPLPQ